MNVKISAVHYIDVYEIIKKAISSGLKEYICLTDVGNVISASRDDLLKNAINTSLLSLADGAPLACYARLAGYRNIERISGVRLMESLFAERDGHSHYLLGDTDQTIQKVIKKVRADYRGIIITGHSPPFKDFDQNDNRKMIKKILKAKPDIIWVCFGGGKQEKWMKDNVDSLERGVMVGVGSALRWFTDDLQVPPVILQKLCLQWLYRLVCELKKDPRKGMKFFIERQLYKFPTFLFKFPFELALARRRYKQQNRKTDGRRNPH